MQWQNNWSCMIKHTDYYQYISAHLSFSILISNKFPEFINVYNIWIPYIKQIKCIFFLFESQNDYELYPLELCVFYHTTLFALYISILRNIHCNNLSLLDVSADC